jgi:hypothetical protein
MKIGKQKLQEKNLQLPSYQVIDQFIKTLDFSQYVVNYLTFYFGFRNKDVNLYITTRKLTKNINTENNYLIVKKTEIELIINDYKTIKQYLQKRIVIRNKHFVEVCNNLHLSTYLLTRNENPINEIMSAIKTKGTENRFNKFVFDWVAINNLKVPNYQPFVTTQYQMQNGQFVEVN